MLEKSHIVSGYDSVATVEPLGIRGYGIIRKSDNVILAASHRFKKYQGDIITTCRSASGDIVLKSDKHGVICKL